MAILAGCEKQSASSAPADPQTLAIRGVTFGVVQFNVTFAVPASPEVTPEQLQQRVDEELDGINKRMSTYIPESEVSRFNASESTDWFAVSADTALVVDASLKVSRQTEGAFDITVGPLVEAWNFGKRKGATELPDDARIEALKKNVGYDLLEVRHDPAALRKQRPAVQIDLSAIAKGYAVDRVSALLLELGYADHLVEIGGEDRAHGERPGGGPWRVGIERPDQKATIWDNNSNDFLRIVLLQNEAIATSGDYRNFFVGPDGKRYSHTIDPRLGRPIEHRVASVSVVADDCLTADAWATALGVLGPERGSVLAQQFGLETLIVYRTDEESFAEKTTGRFSRKGEE